MSRTSEAWTFFVGTAGFTLLGYLLYYFTEGVPFIMGVGVWLIWMGAVTCSVGLLLTILKKPIPKILDKLLQIEQDVLGVWIVAVAIWGILTRLTSLAG